MVPRQDPVPMELVRVDTTGPLRLQRTACFPLSLVLCTVAQQAPSRGPQHSILPEAEGQSISLCQSRYWGPGTVAHLLEGTPLP